MLPTAAHFFPPFENLMAFPGPRALPLYPQDVHSETHSETHTDGAEKRIPVLTAGNYSNYSEDHDHEGP